MKKSYYLLCFLLAYLLVTSFANAAGYQHLTTREGVEVMIMYDPLGPNNEIVADIKFTNENPYRVEVNWKPIFVCDGGEKVEGAYSSFNLNEGASYFVNIWRLSACGQRRIEDFSVEMGTAKTNP